MRWKKSIYKITKKDCWSQLYFIYNKYVGIIRTRFLTNQPVVKPVFLQCILPLMRRTCRLISSKCLVIKHCSILCNSWSQPIFMYWFNTYLVWLFIVSFFRQNSSQFYFIFHQISEYDQSPHNFHAFLHLNVLILNAFIPNI